RQAVSARAIGFAIPCGVDITLDDVGIRSSPADVDDIGSVSNFPRIPAKAIGISAICERGAEIGIAAGAKGIEGIFQRGWTTPPTAALRAVRVDLLPAVNSSDIAGEKLVLIEVGNMRVNNRLP